MRHLLLLGSLLLGASAASALDAGLKAAIDQSLAQRAAPRAAAGELESLSCNYQYSDNACENSSVGALCYASGAVGVCVQVDSTGDTADCRCVPDDNPPPPPSGGNTCNYQYSDNACENSTVGALCYASGTAGVCVQVDSTGNTADCRCVADDRPPPPPPPPPPPTGGRTCNYQYSDNACENSSVGAGCYANGSRGVCVQVDSTGDTADCRCVADDNPPPPPSGRTCNYQYSDNACENSTVGALCYANGAAGSCVQVDSTGDTADCRCVP